jgi:hypothetical protein
VEDNILRHTSFVFGGKAHDQRANHVPDVSGGVHVLLEKTPLTVEVELVRNEVDRNAVSQVPFDVGEDGTQEENLRSRRV